MSVELKVEGVDKLSRLTKALWKYGEKDLRIELYRGINRAAKPLGQDVRNRLRFYLPDRYADELYVWMRIRAKRRATGRAAGVRLVATAKPPKGGKERDLRSLNRGRLRHPLYGNRKYWYNQPVTPGFWDKPLEDNSERIREELINLIDDIGKRLDSAVARKAL